MGDFFGTLLEQFMGLRWLRYLVAAIVVIGTVVKGDFSTALPWLVLAIITGWLVIHALIDRYRANKRGPMR
jgi:hypothetical protein